MMADPDSQIGSRNHIARPLKSARRVPNAGNVALCERAIRWLFPWTQRSYPGFRKGALSVLPRAYTWQVVQHWQKNNREMPAPVAHAIAVRMETTALEGLEIATELRAHTDGQDARPKRMVGCCAIPEDGLDRRGRWRR